MSKKPSPPFFQKNRQYELPVDIEIQVNSVMQPNAEPLIDNTLGESQTGPSTNSLLTSLHKHLTDSG